MSNVCVYVLPLYVGATLLPSSHLYPPQHQPPPPQQQPQHIPSSHTLPYLYPKHPTLDYYSAVCRYVHTLLTQAFGVRSRLITLLPFISPAVLPSSSSTSPLITHALSSSSSSSSPSSTPSSPSSHHHKSGKKSHKPGREAPQPQPRHHIEKTEVLI